MIVVQSGMAKSNNLPAKKYSAGERTELNLRFVWDAGATGGDVYIDIAKALSAVNRRFYRQGLYYYISSIRVHDNTGGNGCFWQFDTIPDTWVTKAAWKRAFRAYQKMNARALEAGGIDITPKYHDFKVVMSSVGASGNTLNPVGGGNSAASATVYAPDDWDISQFVTDDPTMTDTGSYIQQDDEDPDTFIIHMVGSNQGGDGNWTSVGAIASLNDTWPRAAVSAPTLDTDADTDPIANLFDAGDTHDDIRQLLDGANDSTPYDHNMMVGAANSEEFTLSAQTHTSTGAGATAHVPGFCVPLGLIRVRTTSSGGLNDVECNIKLVPGSYHGVYAERLI